MLTELRITGLGVIDDAILEPHPGLTAVTGETGAGKTMVVTALGLITGGRADAGRVRAGADRAVVEARIAVRPGDPALSIIEATGGQLDDGELILIRSVSSDGRSRGHIGGRSAPLASLAELTDSLVAVHGQSEAITLLQPAQQRAVLDRFAHTEDLLSAYRLARGSWQSAVSDLTDRIEHTRERALREQTLKLGLEEIDRVVPLPGEDAALIAEVRRLENADSLRFSAQQALEEISGDPMSDAAHAVGLVAAARRELDGSPDERLRALGAELHQVTAVLGDVAAELAGYLSDLDADPARLEEMLSRQAVLRGLTRRYGTDIDAVLAWKYAAEQELEELDSSEETLAALRVRCAELGTAVAKAAAALSRRRSAAAKELGESASAELVHLAMGRADLRVSVTHRSAAPGAVDAVEVDGAWVATGGDGIDQVEFLMRSHQAAPELPIAKGASGGELSRVMLAIEVVLAGADPVATLVFDEVDAGVGGRAATEIGRRLAMLARSHQVIVVTHLAQVAAFADRHVVVDAADDGAVRASSLRTVVAAERELELARMLGGTDGETARAHAADLLTAAVVPVVNERKKSAAKAGAQKSAAPRAVASKAAVPMTGASAAAAPKKAPRLALKRQP